jgi:multidrug efflux pump subunit AcrA (membrane-fusion protein)
MGFLMLLFMPCLYCNVSDSWLFRDRWKRIAVMLAGSYCELLIWAAAVFVWRLALPGTLHYQLGWTLASVTGTRVAFNFNPLMKLDGYYILSDLVAVPNLRQRSQDAMTGHLRRVLWGAPRPGRIPKGRMLVAFGIATWLFSLAVLALILVGLTRSLNGPWGPVGLVVVIPLMVGILRSLFVGFSAGELTEMVRRRRERTAVWASILALLPPMATVGEVEDWAGGSFALRSRSQAEIRAPVGGFLRDLDREEGDSVSPGEVIARIEVPDLDNRLKQARASVRESRAKLRLLEVGPRPEEVREQRRRVERAKAWRDLARRDLSRAEQAFQADLERLGSQMAQARAETDYTESVLARNKKLQGRGAVSAEQIVEADAKHRIAKAQTEQAKAQRQARQAEGTLEAEAELARRESELAEAGAALALLEAGTRPEEIEAEQARLARLEAEVLYLEGVQVKTRVTSPVAGRLTTPHLRELVGHYYQEGELIGEVKSPSALEAEIRMTEQDSARIRPGQRIELKIRALPFKKVYARVDRIAPVAAPPPSSRESPVPPGEMPSSVTISCRLEDPPAVLRPGMTGYAHVARGRRPIGEIAAERAVRLLRTEYWW